MLRFHLFLVICAVVLTKWRANVCAYSASAASPRMRNAVTSETDRGRLSCHHQSIANDVTERNKLKVLCLHGYMSCGSELRDQMASTLRTCSDVADFVFVDAPHALKVLGGRTKKRKRLRWWQAIDIDEASEYFSTHRQENSFGGIEVVQRYDGLYESLSLLSRVQKDLGPFDVVMGHSQGAVLTVILDALRCYPDILDDVREFAKAYRQESEQSEIEDEDENGVYNPDTNNERARDTNTFSSTAQSADLTGSYSSSRGNGTRIEERDISFPEISAADLPFPVYRVILSGFMPRDQCFRVLREERIGREVLAPVGIANSLHVIAADDPILPAKWSIFTSGMYRNPKLLIHESDQHNPPYDVSVSNSIAEYLQRVWEKTFQASTIHLEP